MRLYSDNPHYIEYHGEPVLLVGSGEHYGAVINRQFDYRPYLAEQARCGLNLVRIFSGTYRELPGEFGIQDNNLGPAAGEFLSPWVEGPDGKYDLSHFNPEYLSRLRDFISLAASYEIVVEFSLFCFWYNPLLWEASPMHPANNSQAAGPTDKEQVYSLQNNELLRYQEDLVRWLVKELNEFDNLYYEITNEPYSRHDHTAYLDWQHHIADVIAQAEGTLPNRHLIAINYQNRTQRIPYKHPAVSICNFHYAVPDAVKENFHLNCVISDDETGFAGQVPAPYRREAWNFMLAGGGAFSHLDYSFTCAHPDGTAPIEGSTPGYGGADLRLQLGFMRRYLEEAEIWKMQPYNEIFGWNAGNVQAQVMGDPHRCYLAYFPHNITGSSMLLALPAGKYDLEWVNPTFGRVFSKAVVMHPGGYHRVDLPGHNDDLVMKICKLS